MKYIITENQLESIKDKILKISFKVFDNDWNTLQEFLNKRGNPPYIITDDVSLYKNKEIKTLGSLISVEGYLYLNRTSIKSLGNLISVGSSLDLKDTSIESLGNLTSVGGSFNLYNTSIKSLGNLTYVGGVLFLKGTPIENFGNLTHVGGDLYLDYTPISKKYTAQQIRDMVQVDGSTYL